MFGNRKFVSRELLKKKRKRFCRLFVFYSICILILLSIVIFVPRMKYFVIKEVVVSGTVVENSDILSDFVKEKIRGNYFFVVSKRNWLFYPQKSAELAVLQNFKRLNKAEISFEGNNTLLLEVAERKPDWIWCEESRCYFLDETGFIFDEAPNFSGNVYFETIGGGVVEEGGSAIGQYFAPTGWDLAEIKSFLKALSDFAIEAESLLVTVDGDIEVNILDNGYLKLGSNKDLNSAYNDLKNSIDGGEVSFEKKYEYIDLRFINKIFYKLAK